MRMKTMTCCRVKSGSSIYVRTFIIKGLLVIFLDVGLVSEVKKVIHDTNTKKC